MFIPTACHVYTHGMLSLNPKCKVHCTFWVMDLETTKPMHISTSWHLTNTGFSITFTTVYVHATKIATKTRTGYVSDRLYSCLLWSLNYLPNELCVWGLNMGYEKICEWFFGVSWKFIEEAWRQKSLSPELFSFLVDWCFLRYILPAFW